MKLRVLALAFALVLGIGAGGVASAGAPSQPGTPGTPNCHGQTIAYINQLGPGGLAQAAAAVGLTVKDAQDLVQQYCDQAP